MFALDTNHPSVQSLIKLALDEDLGGAQDVSTEALVDPALIIDAQIISRQDCYVAGGSLAAAVFGSVDSSINYKCVLADGKPAAAGEVVALINGSAAAILTAERTALNFMQRLCGVATITNSFVERCAPYGVTVLDTRKTTPGHRIIEKYAVICGGGANHRMGLYDRVLIKDNHRGVWHGRNQGMQGLADAVLEARRRFPELVIEIEIESIAELKDVLPAAPDWVLLDNMTPELMGECVKLAAGKVKFEASGGINLETVEAVARSGIDAVSLGCLTHSAPSIDLSLELV